MDNFVTNGMDIVRRSTCALTTNIQRRNTMQLHDELSGDVFTRNFPVDGSTIGEHHDEYFGLIDKRRANMPELHGHVVAMDGTVVVPELRPTASTSVLSPSSHAGSGMAAKKIRASRSSEEIMELFENNTIGPAFDDYIGDELTWDDLQRGYAAFLEDSSRMTA
jgi:hypothetical protein